MNVTMISKVDPLKRMKTLNVRKQEREKIQNMAAVMEVP